MLNSGLPDPYSNGYGLNFPSSPLISSFQEVYSSLNQNEEINVLDVGCGLGPNVYLNDVWDFKYTGIDPSDYAIAAATDKWNRRSKLQGPKFYVTSLKNFAFCNTEFFDVVLDRASMQHIEQSEYQLLQSPIWDVHNILTKYRKSRTPGGFWISQWASKDVDFSAITKNFKAFTGFEEVENEIRKYFEIEKLTKISTSTIIPELDDISEYVMIAKAKILSTPN